MLPPGGASLELLCLDCRSNFGGVDVEQGLGWGVACRRSGGGVWLVGGGMWLVGGVEVGCGL